LELPSYFSQDYKMSFPCFIKTVEKPVPLFTFVLLLIFTVTKGESASLSIACDSQSPAVQFGAGKISGVLRALGHTVRQHDWVDKPGKYDIAIVSSLEALNRLKGKEADLEKLQPLSLTREGYILFPADNRSRWLILATDIAGAMYGAMDLAEQLTTRGSLERIEEKKASPRFATRAVKFNLPWSAYRPGLAADPHWSVCRDLAFWRRFLEMMAENRLNKLTLWNVHPFPYLIRSRKYPEACPFTEQELAGWRDFWRALFRMAKELGIETYLVNWNIVVPKAFAERHQAKELNDTSEIVRDYTRESIAQLLREYEDLTGLGVTQADWMNNMTPRERSEWVEQTFLAGIRESRRPVKFIYRSVLTNSPEETRRLIDEAALPDPVVVEVKFNWSHAYSTPRLAITHDNENGQIQSTLWDPPPERYRIAWMIRNEDIFILRWGDPEFIREHIRLNGGSFVDGYFIGSEGMIPAKDVSHRTSSHQTWQYGFEKQWLLYRLWGRLLYDPELPNEFFEKDLGHRYGKERGAPLLRAYSLVSRVPLQLASFHAATWDYTLYSEGFLAPNRSRGYFEGVSPFISLDELIQHEPLDPLLISIPHYVEAFLNKRELPEGKKTPLEFGEKTEKECREALGVIAGLRAGATLENGALECELNDLETWSHLGFYLADKIRAGVALEIYRRTGGKSQQERAIGLLERCLSHWDEVIRLTDSHYQPVPYTFTSSYHYKPPAEGELFSWRLYRNQVRRDIELARISAPAPRPNP
jgi:hypothetical protein